MPAGEKKEEAAKPLFNFAPAAGGLPSSFPTATANLFTGFGTSTSFASFGGGGGGFGGFSAAPQPASGFPAVGGKDDDEGGDSEPSVLDDDGGVRTNAGLIKTGEGEEGEVTLFELEKAKFFVQKDAAWTDVGVGMLKLNKNEATGKTRILYRAEGTGRVLLNSALFPLMGVQKAEGKKDVIITTIRADKKTAMYLIRCKNPEEATKLQETLDKHKVD